MKWQPSALLLFGEIGALLAGCSVGPTYQRPDIALPAQWSESASAAASGVSASVWPAAEWWHGFGSAKLDELIAEGERNNDDPAGAALLPSLDLGATAIRERAQTASLGAGGRVFNLFSPGLTASYEIDFWG